MKILIKKAIRCDHCGKLINIDKDGDCVEMEMFRCKSICTCYEHDSKYYKVHTGKLYFCGPCQDILKSEFVRAYASPEHMSKNKKV